MISVSTFATTTPLIFSGTKNQLTLGVAPTWGVLQDNRFANDFGNRGGPLSLRRLARTRRDNEQTSLNLDFYAQDRFYFLPQWAVVVGAQVTYASRENEDDFPTQPESRQWRQTGLVGLFPEGGPALGEHANVQSFAM